MIYRSKVIIIYVLALDRVDRCLSLNRSALLDLEKEELNYSWVLFFTEDTFVLPENFRKPIFNFRFIENYNHGIRDKNFDKRNDQLFISNIIFTPSPQI